MLGGIGSQEIILINLILFVVPFWKIFSKAGFSRWLSLIVLFPGLILVALYYLAFAKWPYNRALIALKSAKEMPDADFDIAVKRAVKLEIHGDLEKALREYQRIVDDAQSCMNVIRKRLTGLEKHGGVA